MSDFRRHLEKQLEDDKFTHEYEKQFVENRLFLFRNNLIKQGVSRVDANKVCICMEYIIDVFRGLID